MIGGQELKQELIRLAEELGFDDIRFIQNPWGERSRTAAFLIRRYTPSRGEAPEGRIALSVYYVCSQAAHRAADAFVAAAQAKFGLVCEKSNAEGAKAEILKTGGRQGINSLYFHPKFGSYISFRTVLIDALIPPDEGKEEENLCQNCGVCARQCPTGAITKDGFIREKCLRDMYDKTIPEEARDAVYQLLGCEKCQIGCPMNTAGETEAMTFDLIRVLEGKETQSLKAIAGSNMATRTRLLVQAAAFAAARGYRPALNAVSHLAEDDSERVREMALWAKERL